MSTVYVIAEEPAARSALVSLLSREGHETACFRSISAFLSELPGDPSGCVIVDLQPPCATVGAMPQLQAMCEPMPTIVLSPAADVAFAVRAMKEGAIDFLEKPVDAARLSASVSFALAKSAARLERARRKQELRARFERLSNRERDVVDAVLDGCGNREVASQLGISARTVETHRSNAMIKLGARTLADLVRIWLDLEVAAVR
jgi:two-component system response regulator FixJ